MSVAPSELYCDVELRNTLDLTWNITRYGESLEGVLTAADVIVELEDPVAYLDDLEDRDRDAWHDAKKIITGLPGKTIFEHYGVEVLAWAAATTSIERVGESLTESLAEHAGFDAGLFEKARLWEWQKAGNNKGKNVLRQYQLMESVTGGALDDIDLKSVLVNAAKPGVTLSEKRLADYSLMPIRSRKNSYKPDGPAVDWYGLDQLDHTLDYNIWLDAPTAIALTYKGVPNAVAGIIAKGPDEIMITQLQGVQAKRLDPARSPYDEGRVIGVKGARGLAPIDWQKALVDATAEFAKNMGVQSIAIQSGFANKWVRTILVGETTAHLSLSAATRAYDIPAARLGFRRQEDRNWHRPV